MAVLKTPDKSQKEKTVLVQEILELHCVRCYAIAYGTSHYRSEPGWLKQVDPFFRKEPARHVNQFVYNPPLASFM